MLKFIRKLVDSKNKQEAAYLKQSIQVDLSVIFLKVTCIFIYSFFPLISTTFTTNLLYIVPDVLEYGPINSYVCFFFY